MVNFSNQSVMSADDYLQLDLDELIREANNRPSGEPFHVRDLVDPAVWRAWYTYWDERNISVVLHLGKKFSSHPRLKADFKEYDPNPNDGAAVYMNP